MDRARLRSNSPQVAAAGGTLANVLTSEVAAPEPTDRSRLSQEVRNRVSGAVQLTLRLTTHSPAPRTGLTEALPTIGRSSS